ncbi:MAG TPA: hypothetical protein VJH23_05420 [archaeon]|nr:hypothetical protein [archaeon]
MARRIPLKISKAARERLLQMRGWKEFNPGASVYDLKIAISDKKKIELKLHALRQKWKKSSPADKRDFRESYERQFRFLKDVRRLLFDEIIDARGASSDPLRLVRDEDTSKKTFHKARLRQLKDQRAIPKD